MNDTQLTRLRSHASREQKLRSELEKRIIAKVAELNDDASLDEVMGIMDNLMDLAEEHRGQKKNTEEAVRRFQTYQKELRAMIATRTELEPINETRLERKVNDARRAIAPFIRVESGDGR